MKNLVHGFLHWWEDAPFYLSIWFIPFVAILFVIAFIKNTFIGDKQ